MCNNIVALGSVTADGSIIFGKNSDRERNEAHDVRFVPRLQHPPDSVTHCTYIDISQVKETFAVLLSKPAWLWGAEMAANEQGLVIGNTAVFTKIPYETGPGLIGMDFLRLAVERCKTAHEAVMLITTLLEAYGQGGNHGFTQRTYYHNSFLLADPESAWVLETAGKQWAARQIQDIYVTSNVLSIEQDWDLASTDLVDYAVQRGWCKSKADFSFKRCYSGAGFYPSYLFTVFSKAEARECRLYDLLEARRGAITVQTVMQALRDHGAQADANWSPSQGFFENAVCMHAAFGPIRNTQAVGSMVSHLKPDYQTHWITGTSAPCTSIFKPVWFDGGLPDIGLSPTERYNRAALWWRHEALHRTVLRDYASRLAVYQTDRDQMETDFISYAATLETRSAAERRVYSQQAFETADRASQRWLELVQDQSIEQSASYLYQRAWGMYDKVAHRVEDGSKLTHIP